MNKEFMRSFYRKYYAHSYDKAVSHSKRYRRLQKIRYQLDDELAAMMGGTNTALYKKFDEYIGAYADEMDVMLEEVYLLGALDREKMLR